MPERESGRSATGGVRRGTSSAGTWVTLWGSLHCTQCGEGSLLNFCYCLGHEEAQLHLPHLRGLRSLPRPRAFVSADGIVTIAGLRWALRDGTTDWNTVVSCSQHDEYGVANIDVRGKLVFDIGAHIGGFGVWLASRGAHVVMIEPLEDNVNHILANLAINRLMATVIAGALGTNYVCHGPAGDAHEFIGVPLRSDGAAPAGSSSLERVPEVTFSELVKEFGPPNIVKIDCEGGEWSAFHDEEIRQVPLIVGEHHPDPHGGDYVAKDIAWLLPKHAVTVGDVPTLGNFRATLLV